MTEITTNGTDGSTRVYQPNLLDDCVLRSLPQLEADLLRLAEEGDELQTHLTTLKTAAVQQTLSASLMFPMLTSPPTTAAYQCLTHDILGGTEMCSARDELLSDLRLRIAVSQLVDFAANTMPSTFALWESKITSLNRRTTTVAAKVRWFARFRRELSRRVSSIHKQMVTPVPALLLKNGNPTTSEPPVCVLPVMSSHDNDEVQQLFDSVDSFGRHLTTFTKGTAELRASITSAVRLISRDTGAARDWLLLNPMGSFGDEQLWKFQVALEAAEAQRKRELALLQGKTENPKLSFTSTGTGKKAAPKKSKAGSRAAATTNNNNGGGGGGGIPTLYFDAAQERDSADAELRANRVALGLLQQEEGDPAMQLPHNHLPDNPVRMQQAESGVLVHTQWGRFQNEGMQARVP